MKKVFGLLLTITLFFSATTFVNASLIIINSQGEVIWNVLSEEASITLEVPTHSSIEIKKSSEGLEADSNVSLTKRDGKISLIVSVGNETKELVASNLQDDLVEIEERPEVQKLAIGVKDDKFSLQQKGVVALTDFPIQIDAKSAKISVTTATGDKYLSILPFQAVESILRTKLINRLSRNTLAISEKDNQLQYKIDGEKIFNFYNLFEYAIPVSAYVSASTGEILSIDSPTIFKYLGFLFI